MKALLPKAAKDRKQRKPQQQEEAFIATRSYFFGEKEK